jgi:hypothetical protein
VKLALAVSITLVVTSSPAAPPSWKLDDFESPDHVLAHGLAWIGLGDDLLGGRSRIRLESLRGGASGTGRALRLEGTLGEGPTAFTGAWVPLDGQARPVDLSAFDAIRLRIRGEGTFRVGVRRGPLAAAANFMASFVARPEWRTVEVGFDELAPVGQAAAEARWSPTEAHWLGITTTPATPRAFRLDVDEVELVSRRGVERPSPSPDDGPPRALRISLSPAPRAGSWEELARDAPGDGQSAALPDATSLSVWRRGSGDRVWFRIGLREAAPERWLGLNLVLDTDGDPDDGAAWWGSNAAFHYDRLVTVWLFRTNHGYQGVAGIAEAPSVAEGEMMAGGTDVLVALDRDPAAFLVGVPRAALGTGTVRLVAAVGSALMHNDDVPGEGAASFSPTP